MRGHYANQNSDSPKVETIPIETLPLRYAQLNPELMFEIQLDCPEANQKLTTSNPLDPTATIETRNVTSGHSRVKRNRHKIRHMPVKRKYGPEINTESKLFSFFKF